LLAGLAITVPFVNVKYSLLGTLDNKLIGLQLRLKNARDTPTSSKMALLASMLL